MSIGNITSQNIRAKSILAGAFNIEAVKVAIINENSINKAKRARNLSIKFPPFVVLNLPMYYINLLICFHKKFFYCLFQ